jgi:flagellar hook protein FlgE
MGLQSAMTTALTGLQAAETTIDIVGNNVANSNTVGFKESDVLFATQFLQTRTIGSAPSANSGGTNPRQIGLGVKISEIAPNFTQGTIQVSANPLDLAIQGDGFLIVAGPQGAGQELYTRNGQLKVNSQNEIVTITGHRVLGYTVNDQFVINSNQLQPLTIPFGGSAVAQETNRVNLAGNLLPNSELVATTPGVIQSVVLSDRTVEIPSNFGPDDIRQIGSVTIPPATSATAVAGGTIEAGTYRYRITFVDPSAFPGNDEGPPSVEFGTVTVDGTQQIDLQNLPTSPDPAVFTMKRIYRTDNSGVYRLVDEIAASATSYLDGTQNAALGPELNDDTLDLANYSYFVTFSNASLESRPTSQSATIAISLNDRRIRINNIPQPEPGSQFDTIRIYRNVRGQPGSYYEVAQLPVGVTTYIDNKPDALIENPLNLLDRNGPPVNLGTPLINVSTFDGTNYVDLFQEGRLQFTGSKGANGGLDLATKELQITATTTVLDLINFMQEALGIQLVSPDPDNPLSGDPGGSLTGDSRLRFESNAGVHNAVNIDQNAFRLVTTAGAPQSVPLYFSEVQTADGTGTTSEMIVYDSLGIPLTVRLTTVLESTSGGVTTYRWFATSPDNQPATGVTTAVGTGLVTFGGTGKFISTTDNTVTIDRREVAANSPVTFDLDFSQVTALSKQATLQMSSQDGFAAGTLASFSITESGRIKGAYSNGVTRDLGQIVMAKFANNNGLQQVGDNLWAKGVNSGEPLRDTPGASGIGTITAGAVELSNTDIGQNLIELILASTQYRGGTRVITSAQQLLDELLSLRR